MPADNTESAPPIRISISNREPYCSHTHQSCPSEKRNRLSLLLGHTNGSATATSCLGVLATYAEAPVVSQTTVGSDLLEALQVLTELAVNAVGEDLAVLAVHDVSLPVKEPGGDLVYGVISTEQELNEGVRPYTAEGFG